MNKGIPDACQRPASVFEVVFGLFDAAQVSTMVEIQNERQARRLLMV